MPFVLNGSPVTWVCCKCTFHNLFFLTTFVHIFVCKVVCWQLVSLWNVTNQYLPLNPLEGSLEVLAERCIYIFSSSYCMEDDWLQCRQTRTLILFQMNPDWKWELCSLLRKSRKAHLKNLVIISEDVNGSLCYIRFAVMIISMHWPCSACMTPKGTPNSVFNAHVWRKDCPAL